MDLNLVYCDFDSPWCTHFFYRVEHRRLNEMVQSHVNTRDDVTKMSHIY